MIRLSLDEIAATLDEHGRYENLPFTAEMRQFCGRRFRVFKRADKMAFESTPILVDDFLYLSTPTSIVIALNPTTGQERWRYDPRIPRNASYSEATSRGVSWRGRSQEIRRWRTPSRAGSRAPSPPPARCRCGPSRWMLRCGARTDGCTASRRA